MHEALCRSSGTTLDILHVERRAADHSANIGSNQREHSCSLERGGFLPFAGRQKQPAARQHGEGRTPLLGRRDGHPEAHRGQSGGSGSSKS